MNHENFRKLNKLIDTYENNMIDLCKFLNREEFFELARKVNINNIKIQKEEEFIKFRRWEGSWQLPKEIKIKEEIIKYRNSRKDQNIIKRNVWTKIETLKEFQKRWAKDAPKYWGNQAKIPYAIENRWIWCKVHDNWIFDKIVPKSEDFVYKDKWIYHKIPKNYIGISYDSSDYHTHFILIPSLIKSDSFFFEGLGLQQGDGTQSLYDTHITFTNGCIDLVLHQIEWFKRLGISKDVLRIYPEIPESYEEKFQVFKAKLRDFGINENQFRKKKSFLTNTKNILIQLVFHNKLFKLVYLYMLYQSRNNLLNNEDSIKSYLRGLIAAEGSVRLRKKGNVLNDIKISASSEEIREFIKQCLINVNIIPSKDELTKGSEAVIIRRFNNFLKLKEFSALSLHPKKQEKFINGLSKYQRIGGTKYG